MGVNLNFKLPMYTQVWRYEYWTRIVDWEWCMCKLDFKFHMLASSKKKKFFFEIIGVPEQYVLEDQSDKMLPWSPASIIYIPLWLSTVSMWWRRTGFRVKLYILIIDNSTTTILKIKVTKKIFQCFDGSTPKAFHFYREFSCMALGKRSHGYPILVVL